MVVKKRTPAILGAKAPKKQVVPDMQDQSIEERREAVFRRRLRGEQRKDIARSLGVSLGTVKNDLIIIRKQNAEYVDEYQQHEFVGMSMAMFEEVSVKAWKEYDDGATGAIRLKALDLARNLTKDQIRLLQEVGMLKVRKGEDSSDEDLKTFLNSISQRSRERLIKDVIGEALPTDLAEPTLNEIADAYEDEEEEIDDDFEDDESYDEEFDEEEEEDADEGYGEDEDDDDIDEEDDEMWDELEGWEDDDEEED